MDETLERQNQGLRRTVRTLLDEAEALENTGVFLIELIEAQGLVIERQDAEIARLNALVEELNAADEEAESIIKDDCHTILQLRSELAHAKDADAEAEGVIAVLMDENAELREAISESRRLTWGW